MRVFFFICLTFFCMVSSAKTIYLVRHAEKVEDGSKDPELTMQGEERAHNIADMLSQVGINKIYSTDYQRTQMTAKPLATHLGLEVNSYDPRQLNEFSEQLKNESGNALIVGHSNTTPMLAFLLSGHAVSNLDEANYDNVYQVHFLDGKKYLNVLKSSPSHASAPLSKWKPLNDRFFEGSLTFNMLYKGEEVGQSKHVFKATDDEYILNEHTQIDAMNIDAQIKAKVKADNLQPIHLSMKGIMGTDVDIQLNWSGNQVFGHTQMGREAFKKQGRIDINHSLRPKTIERTSAIMLAHLIPVSAEQPLLVNWFNGYDGDDRLIEVSFHGEEKITVPAGTFDTYKIEYKGGGPSQYFWIDKKQAKVVKIEVIKMPWSYELVSH